MNERRFSEFLHAVKEDPRTFYHYETSKPFNDVIDEIYDDVKKFRYYTLDGRFQDLFIRVSQEPDCATWDYQKFLAALEVELKKLIVPNLIMLPLNFLDSKIIKSDLIINEYIRLFLPTAIDLENHTKAELLLRQEERRKNQFDEPICKYFDSVLDGHLDKEHILLAKDKDFFRYPVLTIYIESIDARVEDEAKFITEAIYSLLRMIDYKTGDQEYYEFGRGAWQKAKFGLSNTYTVYYNVNDGYPSDHPTYYGLSSKFNYSGFLDISSSRFLNNTDWFCKALDIFIKASFIDKRKFSNCELDILNKWCNAILLYNTAYEFASIEKYDACVLILSSLLESIFLQNTGRNKSELLANELSQFLIDIYPDKKIDDLVQIVKILYKYRNKIIHEGVGLEKQFIRPCDVNAPQGEYRGMKPFHYAGSFYPDKDLMGIDIILKCLVDILMGEKMLGKISNILEPSCQ